jgi:hypothetical protein
MPRVPLINRHWDLRQLVQNVLTRVCFFFRQTRTEGVRVVLRMAMYWTVVPERPVRPPRGRLCVSRAPEPARHRAGGGPPGLALSLPATRPTVRKSMFVGED